MIPPLTIDVPLPIDAVSLRAARADDAAACGRIAYEAFHAISTKHNFIPDFPSPEVAIGLMNLMLSHPGIYGVVAERDGRVIGSNFLWEQDAIAGVGPITVDPAAQDAAVGRRLMEDVLRRADARGQAGVRLVQAGYHGRSLSLYAKLGFDVREPLACLNGPALNFTTGRHVVRPATHADVPACNALCRSVHGIERGGELGDAIRQGTATVVELEGRIAGYATGIGFFGHAVGRTIDELKALIGAAKEISGPGLLLPTRQAELFRWCLAQGLRVVQPMTLMSRGPYQAPAGAFLPSILY